MWAYYSAILLVVLSNLVYHLSQKNTPSTINPMVSLLVTYVTAAVVTVALLPLFPTKEGLAASLKQMNWASITLGLAVVGLELGFLLAYRAGWNISIAQFYATILLTLILVPTGVIFFHDKLSLVNILGIVLCLGGFIMLNHK